jgi:hypothetical protein
VPSFSIEYGIDLVGPNSSSGRVAEHATSYNEYAHPPFSDHQTKDSLPSYVTDESEEAQVEGLRSYG